VILSMNMVQSVPYSSVEKAFESNDYHKITALSKSKVIINVSGSEGVYSKSQAGLILKEFITDHPCKGFNFTFKGKATSKGAFAIGNYESNSDFRVTIHFEQINGSYKIENLSIE